MTDTPPWSAHPSVPIRLKLSEIQNSAERPVCSPDSSGTRHLAYRQFRCRLQQFHNRHHHRPSASISPLQCTRNNWTASTCSTSTGLLGTDRSKKRKLTFTAPDQKFSNGCYVRPNSTHHQPRRPDSAWFAGPWNLRQHVMRAAESTVALTSIPFKSTTQGPSGQDQNSATCGTAIVQGITRVVPRPYPNPLPRGTTPSIPYCHPKASLTKHVIGWGRMYSDRLPGLPNCACAGRRPSRRRRPQHVLSAFQLGFELITLLTSSSSMETQKHSTATTRREHSLFHRARSVKYSTLRPAGTLLQSSRPIYPTTHCYLGPTPPPDGSPKTLSSRMTRMKTT
jgi:hypothetical protein